MRWQTFSLIKVRVSLIVATTLALAAIAGAQEQASAPTPAEMLGPADPSPLSPPTPETSSTPEVPPSPTALPRSESSSDKAAPIAGDSPGLQTSPTVKAIPSPTFPPPTATASATTSPCPEASPSPPDTTLLSHHWIVDERASVMDDSTTVTFSLLGIRDSVTDHPTNDVLILRLREAQWDVMVSTNHEYLGEQFPSIKMRWDKSPAEDELWLSSSDYTAVFCPTPRKFIARASTASRLVVRLFPKFAGESTVVFDLSDLADEIAKHPLAKASLVEPEAHTVKKAKTP